MAKHKSFKLSKHDYSDQQVLYFVVAAIVVGLVVGYFFRDQAIQVLGVFDVVPH